LVTVDGEGGGGAGHLLVGGEVAQHGHLAHFGQNLRRPLVELGEVGILQGVLVLRAGQTAADADVLAGL
jgi:hypothetical protein